MNIILMDNFLTMVRLMNIAKFMPEVDEKNANDNYDIGHVRNEIPKNLTFSLFVTKR